MTMPDYQTMTATEALRHAKEVSGLTTEEIAAAAGIRPAAVRRYLAQDSEDYFPGLDKLPALCRAMRNDVLIPWLAAQIGSRGKGRQAAGRAEVLTAVARAGAALGDVQRVLADSEASGITPVTARELRGLLEDASREARRAADMLRALAAARGLAEAGPLFSLKEMEAVETQTQELPLRYQLTLQEVVQERLQTEGAALNFARAVARRGNALTREMESPAELELLSRAARNVMPQERGGGTTVNVQQQAAQRLTAACVETVVPPAADSVLRAVLAGDREGDG